MAYKCKIVESVNLTLNGHYTHVVYIVQSYWHKKEKKLFIGDKE